MIRNALRALGRTFGRSSAAISTAPQGATLATRRTAAPSPAPAPEADECARLAAYFHQVQINYAPLANPFSAYRRLIHELERLSNLTILPLYELAAASDTTTRLVGLRHDIDADPCIGLRMARFLASRGIGGSFYLLPTAGYYGRLHEGVFVRNRSVAHWTRGLIMTGAELGLHNDALGAAQMWGVDGPGAMVAEIEWLRSQGAVIRGTVAHNSPPAYGAANSEIFRGRRLLPVDRSGVAPDGLPLGVLDEAALQLSYEGTFAEPSARHDEYAARRFLHDRGSASLRSESWMRTFLLNNPTCDWTVDLQMWIIGRDEWVLAGRNPRGGDLFEWKVTLSRALAAVDEAPAGSRILIVLHPEYYEPSAIDEAIRRPSCSARCNQ